MALSNTLYRPSFAGSSNYEPSHRSGYPSTKLNVHAALRPSSNYDSSISSTVRPPSSLARASTVTSATSMSSLIRSASAASTGRDNTAASMTSTLRPPTSASRTTKASTLRASTVTSATSTSKIIRSASTASTVGPPKSSPATSTTSLLRSGSKRAALSYFSTTASRFLWGRPPPGHSTLQPSQIASLTHTLSLPAETPMLSSIVGALPLPLSRSQFSPVPICFCNPHLWFEKKNIEELTEVIAHEIGPQLDKLRVAPQELISKKTKRVLSILQPYNDIFTSVTETSSILSMKPACPACTLTSFFQNPEAVNALTTCVKGRKHRAHPWPASMAWLEPCPGKGMDWETKWKAEGKYIARDRIHVQRWRRDVRANAQVPEEPPQVLGHQPGEGCDFCDGLRMEQADEEELNGAIAEEEEEGRDEEGSMYTHDDHDDHDPSSTPRSSDSSSTLRAIVEESIIKTYLRPSTATTSTFYPPGHHSHNQHHRPPSSTHPKPRLERGRQSVAMEEAFEQRQERERRASDWASSYRCLVGRGPERVTKLQFEREVEKDGGWF